MTLIMQVHDAPNGKYKNLIKSKSYWPKEEGLNFKRKLLFRVNVQFEDKAEKYLLVNRSNQFVFVVLNYSVLVKKKIRKGGARLFTTP